MRLPLALGSSLALAACTLSLQSSGQTRPKPRVSTLPAPATALPITHVSLYKNGVGFFEHAGHVSGDQAVTIDFTSAQLDDVLQSLTAIDLGGGRISGAGYNSTTPLVQQLKTLPLALNDDPTDVDFYQAIRGARVQVSGAGASFSGRLLSIDLRQPPQKNVGGDNGNLTNSRRLLTVVADTGAVRTLELTPAVTVTLLDTALHTDVTRYLQLLAANRSEGLRHLTLTDRGAGARELRVSYISEVPVWKSTYRILFTSAAGASTGDATAATLQGWSVVDNTTGSDWINVHLDLIAGAPQSFIQPLSTPYYARRPEIPLPQEAQLTPQTHESGEMVGQGGSLGGGVFASAAQSTNQVIRTEAADALPLASRNAANMGGLGAGMPAGGGRGPQLVAVAPPPIDYQLAASNSLAPQTTTSAFDDFFAYTLTDPITIRKNESALVPILQTRLPVERVTLWSVKNPVALRALWLTNSSHLTLDRGSFAIIENGSFGGEGLLDPIHPGERRLLSYAADQAVRVTTDHTNATRRVTQITIQAGVLRETSTDIAEVEYLVHNAAPEPRLVIVEQPIRQGWTLDSAGGKDTPDPKPAETTPTAYRFRVATKAGETVHLHIGERHTVTDKIRLVDRTEDQLLLLLRQAKVSDAALAQLQPVFDLHHQVVALDRQIADREAEITAISGDQDRLRKNLAALKGTPEEKALATRYTGELNAQEDRLAALHKEVDQLRIQRARADAEFNAKLDAIHFDQTL